jgi:PPOX class probable F420-dependent enzyme
MPYQRAEGEWWKDFVDALPARTAKVAVVRDDGSPQVAPVWIARDGDQIVFTTGANTVKGKAILRDGRVSLCLDNETPPFDFVTINGTTTTSTDPEELLEWATRIAGRYMGSEQAETYGRRNAVPPEMVVRVTPSKIIAVTRVAD